MPLEKNYVSDYKKATTKQVPAADQFKKVTMVEGEFFEPTEMAILPNLDILVAQRRGELLLFNKATNSVSQVGLLDVYHKTEVPNVNAEEGFMGLTIDPDFEKNNYIYAFYSPKDTSVNRLSRFVFKDNKLDMASEKVVLQFYSQRDICCHTGGSLAFGKDRTLFLSTGDNSTPFDEPNQKYVSNGFSPRDSREGHEQYDVQRSSGNTNDLRGKILRITVKEDGTYDIPAGNLFAKGEPNTKPEIYVMGNRNPYRISIDKKNGFLYWGEVGPDASNDSTGRGPRGYDEVNQARKAGFFGWPYFVGNNYAYNAYNYETGESGAAYDPKKPINDSRNNTGKKELPEAMPAFIWYPYGESVDFPQVGSGGRNAMAGPIYYTDLFPKETRYPDYYDGKLIVYDWIRGWIKAVTMLPNGDFDKMEPFMAGTKFNSPIDMEVGPDGKFYILEYGSGWFSKNPDAAISRIDYNPNTAAASNAKTGEQATGASGPIGHQQGTKPKGESLIEASDCKSCHALDKKSVGPSYKQVAEHYKDNKEAQKILMDKIKNGGSGVWGEVAMAAHPNIKDEDLSEMVKWILSQK
jgi:glucose/arabinose dehydrogenase/cytochrome c551/c552